MGPSSHSSSSIYVYSANSVYPLRLYQFGTIVWLLILLQTEYKCLVAAQGNQGGNNNLRQGPYSPIQSIFFGPLLPRDDRRPIQQRGHNSQQPQQQALHQQNIKTSNAEIIIPPPPPPPVPSRAPKSIGEQQIQDRIDSPTTPPSPSAAPGPPENEGANRNPVASGPGRPSPNPGLHLTPNTEHLAHNHHPPQQQPALQQRNKKFRKNPLRKRPSNQLPSRRHPPPRHRPPIHHPRLRGPPRNGPIPHPPKNIKELGKKKKPGPPNKLNIGVKNQPPPPPPPFRGTPPTPTVRTQSAADQQQLFRSPGVTPPYGSTTGVIPTVSGPQARDSAQQPVEDTHHNHHHGPHHQNPPGFSTSHVQPPLRNPTLQERPRRPIIGNVNTRHHNNNDHRSHQHHPTVPETLTPDGGHNHEHDHANVLPPPPPPIPVIVDQLHRDIPIPDTFVDQLHSPESHHHPPPQTNTLNIPQQQNPLHETEAPQNLLEQRDEASNHHQQHHDQPQQHHQMIHEGHVKQLEELTGISLTRLPLSHEPLESAHDDHQQQNRLSHHDLPVPPPFQQQPVVLDPPSNALYVDSHLSPEEEHHHNHHDHHKEHNLENYHLPDDVLLKISPRGHSSGPVIISQIPVKSFQSADVHLSVKEPMPEKSKYPKTIDAVPATSLAGSGAAVAQLLTAEARPPSSNNLEAQSRSDVNSDSFFYFSQPSDLSASDSEVSSQVAFNSQRIKTKDENENVDHGNHHRRERNGTPRQLNNVDNSHHSNNSEDEDVAIGHNHDHDHKDDENRRIDNEIVRELVDCGGSDLGFCDMNSRYPGHMMGNLMSDCQELVYKGFVPVPEDLEELGDNGPLARYSNASKSAVRARAGSWSWKPYTYKKKQICDSELRFIRPGYARDATGKWQVIVQTESLPQRVAIDLCHSPEKPCSLLSDCGRKSKCIQRYTFQHLLAVDPDNLHDCPTIRAFKFPAACVCHIEFPDYHSEFF